MLFDHLSEEKKNDAARIKRQIEEFQERGGVIQQIPYGKRTLDEAPARIKRTEDPEAETEFEENQDGRHHYPPASTDI